MGDVSQVFLSAEVPRAGEPSCGSYWIGIRNPAMVMVSLEWLRSMTDEVP